MGRVKILQDEVRSKIAAGEVVQNPKSVVKELLENALDAGADKIDIEISRGGKERILVSDNGCGMDRDDVVLAVTRYATSKITQVEDLSCIRSYGFRGEALASISAVSRVAIETRYQGDAVGTQMKIEAGAMSEVRDCGRATGTTVMVYDLFFNLPVRRKFLKSDEWEKRQIVEMVKQYCLVNHQIFLKLKTDARVILQVESAPDLATRVRQLFPRTATQLKTIDEAGEPLSLMGFFSGPVIHPLRRIFNIFLSTSVRFSIARCTGQSWRLIATLSTSQTSSSISGLIQPLSI